jgi:hypothetical protein
MKVGRHEAVFLVPASWPVRWMKNERSGNARPSRRPPSDGHAFTAARELKCGGVLPHEAARIK